MRLRTNDIRGEVTNVNLFAQRHADEVVPALSVTLKWDADLESGVSLLGQMGFNGESSGDTKSRGFLQSVIREGLSVKLKRYQFMAHKVNFRFNDKRLTMPNTDIAHLQIAPDGEDLTFSLAFIFEIDVDEELPHFARNLCKWCSTAINPPRDLADVMSGEAEVKEKGDTENGTKNNELNGELDVGDKKPRKGAAKK